MSDDIKRELAEIAADVERPDYVDPGPLVRSKQPSLASLRFGWRGLDAKVKHIIAEPFNGYGHRVPSLCGRFFVSPADTPRARRLNVCTRCQSIDDTSRKGSSGRAGDAG